MDDHKQQPLITKEQGAIVAATLTAVLGFGAYLGSAAVDLDARLDRLEEDARILIGPEGTIIPARESLEALYGVRALEQRLQRLEGDVQRHH